MLNTLGGKREGIDNILQCIGNAVSDQGDDSDQRDDEQRNYERITRHALSPVCPPRITQNTYLCQVPRPRPGLLIVPLPTYQGFYRRTDRQASSERLRSTIAPQTPVSSYTQFIGKIKG